MPRRSQVAQERTQAHPAPSSLRAGAELRSSECVQPEPQRLRVAVVIPSYKLAGQVLGVLERMGPEVERVYVVDDACLVALFLSKGLLNPDFARTLLSWRHSGFSILSATRIYERQAREALSQYIVRPPLSLQNIHWDRDQDAVSWKSSPPGLSPTKPSAFFTARLPEWIRDFPCWAAPACSIPVPENNKTEV